MNSESSSVCEEIESLMAIYMDELKVSHDPSCYQVIEITIHPATGQNTEQQYVCVTLMFKIPEMYPVILPEIVLKNPRGFSDDEINAVEKELEKKSIESKGHPMIFQLIELCKEFLTASNTPSCECPICLYDFVDSDVFMKTSCYHYFHSYCLASYADQHKKDSKNSSILCPVCRTEISYDSSKTKDDFPAPSESLGDVLTYSTSLNEQQKILKEIYDKQKANGGIIDVEAEKTKYLLHISRPQSSQQAIEKESEAPSDEPTASFCPDYSHSTSKPKYENLKPFKKVDRSIPFKNTKVENQRTAQKSFSENYKPKVHKDVNAGCSDQRKGNPEDRQFRNQRNYRPARKYYTKNNNSYYSDYQNEGRNEHKFNEQKHNTEKTEIMDKLTSDINSVSIENSTKSHANPRPKYANSGRNEREKTSTERNNVSSAPTVNSSSKLHRKPRPKVTAETKFSRGKNNEKKELPDRVNSDVSSGKISTPPGFSKKATQPKVKPPPGFAAR